MSSNDDRPALVPEHAEKIGDFWLWQWPGFPAVEMYSKTQEATIRDDVLTAEVTDDERGVCYEGDASVDRHIPLDVLRRAIELYDGEEGA